jgi:hypothetical protein
MDAGGRAMHGAIAERTQSYLIVHVEEFLCVLCVFAVKAVVMIDSI